VRWSNLCSNVGIKKPFTPVPHFAMRACHIHIDTKLLLALLGPVRGKVSDQPTVWRKVFNFHGLRNETSSTSREDGCEFNFANYVTTDGVALCVHFTALRTEREQAIADANTKWGKRLAALEKRRICHEMESAGPFANLPCGTRVVAFDPGCGILNRVKYKSLRIPVQLCSYECLTMWRC
jgi:hypothetical protein